MITQQQYDELKTERDALAAELEVLSAFRDEVIGVMSESQGVVGWHKNHTIATWDELFPIVPDLKAPAQHLAEIRAEAIDSVNTDELFKLIKPRGGKECGYEVSDWLEKQAAKVRQGGA